MPGKQKAFGDMLRERSAEVPARLRANAEAVAKEIVETLYQRCRAAASAAAASGGKTAVVKTRPPNTIKEYVSEKIVLDRVIRLLKKDRVKASWKRTFMRNGSAETGIPEITFTIEW